MHVALSRHMFGLDTPASVTVEALGELVRGVRICDRALASPVDKDVMADRLDATRTLFTRSAVARHHLSAGTVLAEEDLALKMLGGGMSPTAPGRARRATPGSGGGGHQPLSERHVGP